jgi:hypothetical protein
MMNFRYRRSTKVVRMVAQTEEDTKEDSKVDMGMCVVADIEKVEVDPPHVLIAMRLVISYDFSPNHTYSMHIFIVLNMYLRLFPT